MTDSTESTVHDMIVYTANDNSRTFSGVPTEIATRVVKELAQGKVAAISNPEETAVLFPASVFAIHITPGFGDAPAL